MENFREALNRPDDLPGFDDLLNALGLNRSNYMQGANQRKLIEAVSNGDWNLPDSKEADCQPFNKNAALLAPRFFVSAQSR
jgi:hypothetical protein